MAVSLSDLINNFCYPHWPAKAIPPFNPSMVETSVNSKMVGTMLNTIADNTKLIAREPRSIVWGWKYNYY